MAELEAAVEEGAVSHGIVVDGDTTFWTCTHDHYRANANSRYTKDTNRVWEVSALNCAKRAIEQHKSGKPMIGIHGLVSSMEDVRSRDDHRRIIIEDLAFWGRISLRSNGDRILDVWRELDHESDEPPKWGDVPHEDKRLIWNVLKNYKRASVPKLDSETLRKMVTAMFVLERNIWGVKFKNPGVLHPSEADLEEIDRLAVAELSERYSDTLIPRIQIDRGIDGRRVYEVTGWKGEVVASFVHRGKAVTCLDQVKSDR